MNTFFMVNIHLVRHFFHKEILIKPNIFNTMYISNTIMKSDVIATTIKRHEKLAMAIMISVRPIQSVNTLVGGSFNSSCCCIKVGVVISSKLIVTDFPRISVGPENPLRVEKDDTAQLHCNVDSKPAVTSVKWMRDGRFIDTNFIHLS